MIKKKIQVDKSDTWLKFESNSKFHSNKLRLKKISNNII